MRPVGVVADVVHVIAYHVITHARAMHTQSAAGCGALAGTLRGPWGEGIGSSPPPPLFLLVDLLSASTPIGPPSASDQRAPLDNPNVIPPPTARIERLQTVAGLINEYRQAA